MDDLPKCCTLLADEPQLYRETTHDLYHTPTVPALTAVKVVEGEVVNGKSKS